MEDSQAYFTSMVHIQSRSYQQNDLSKEFHQGGQRRKNRTPTENGSRFDKIEYLNG
jgi:hypothetical protein